MSRIFINIGIILLVISIFFIVIGLWGRWLPGDIIIKRKNFVIIIPVVSMLLISLILTIILNLIGRLWK